MANKLLVVIGGPTGIGKTDLAIRLALHYHTEIISADSRQLYKELKIGVGRPRNQQLEEVPHHLIGVISIHQPFSAADFAENALGIINSLFTQHDIVIMTGGTGMYMQSVMEGLDDIPPVPDEILSRWQQFWEQNGTEALAEILLDMDPAYYAVVDRANPRRLLRAISVCDATGQPFSTFLNKPKTQRLFHCLQFALELPREVLYGKVNQRVLHMMDMGLAEEAKSLFPFRQLKALDTVGYKELFEWLDGKITLDQAVSMIQQSTRRYAKRQMTWFRNRGDWNMVAPDADTLIIEEIERVLYEIKEV